MDHHMASAPSGIWEYVIVAITIAVFLITLYLIIKFFFRPGETEKNHIKKKILDDDSRAGDDS